MAFHPQPTRDEAKDAFVGVKFPRPLLSRLDRRAAARGTTRSELLRQAAERWLQEEEAAKAS